MATATLSLHPAEVLPFPRAKKRGPKTRRGPSAAVLQFPAQLTGDDLRARWAWLLDNHANWRTEDPSGTYENREDWERSARSLGPAYASLRGMAFGEASLRRDVAEWQNVIAKRAKIKAWIRGQGVEPSAFRCADEALAFVYTRVLEADPLSCA